ncbi:MAG: hypothetical protein EOO85_15680 [Pedobacter sp.]|nr:MAG: hypothetical protein EOO85_15680 [Pedobacter sp.]
MKKFLIVLKNSLLIAFIVFTFGCKNEKGQSSETIDKHDSIRVLKQKSSSRTTVNAYESIVISCGSGCAISYSPKVITKQNGVIKVVFRADMHEDEVLTERYDETFFFYYTASRKLDKIIREGEKGDFLQTQMPGSQRAFIEFAAHLNKK